VQQPSRPDDGHDEPTVPPSPVQAAFTSVTRELGTWVSREHSKIDAWLQVVVAVPELPEPELEPDPDEPVTVHAEAHFDATHELTFVEAVPHAPWVSDASLQLDRQVAPQPHADAQFTNVLHALSNVESTELQLDSTHDEHAVFVVPPATGLHVVAEELLLLLHASATMPAAENAKAIAIDFMIPHSFLVSGGDPRLRPSFDAHPRTSSPRDERGRGRFSRRARPPRGGAGACRRRRARP